MRASSAGAVAGMRVGDVRLCGHGLEHGGERRPRPRAGLGDDGAVASAIQRRPAGRVAVGGEDHHAGGADGGRDVRGPGVVARRPRRRPRTPRPACRRWSARTGRRRGRSSPPPRRRTRAARPALRSGPPRRPVPASRSPTAANPSGDHAGCRDGRPRGGGRRRACPRAPSRRAGRRPRPGATGRPPGRCRSPPGAHRPRSSPPAPGGSRARRRDTARRCPVAARRRAGRRRPGSGRRASWSGRWW